MFETTTWATLSGNSNNNPWVAPLPVASEGFRLRSQRQSTEYSLWSLASWEPHPKYDGLLTPPQCHNRTPKRGGLKKGDYSGTMMVNDPLLRPYFLVKVGIWWGGVTLRFPWRYLSQNNNWLWRPCTLSFGAAWALLTWGDAVRPFECGEWGFCYSQEIFWLPGNWNIPVFSLGMMLDIWASRLNFKLNVGNFIACFTKHPSKDCLFSGFQV